MDSMTSLSDIYKCVVENCVKEYDLSDTARDIWLDPLKPVKMEGNTFVLATDIEFKRDTLNNLYVPYIEEQFKNVLGVPIKVKIIVDSSITADKPSISNLINAEPVNETVGEINNKITYTFDNFIVGPSNNLAFVAAKTVAKKQYDKFNPLFIYGDSGLGKTHLLSAIQNEMQKNYPGINIIYIPAETFTNEFLHSISTKTVEQFDEKYRSADALLIDDIQFIAGKDQTEEKFFHIFNELYNQNKAIVLTSDRPAKEIKSISDRLRTRFSSGLIADVKPPEYETRLAIIQRKAELLNFNISDEVIDYIATKLKSNIRQIEGVITKLNALYMVSQMKTTIAVAQSVIKDVVTDHQPIPITVDKIISEVAKIYNIDPDEMRSQRRTANISQARKVAIYVIQDVTGLPYEAIGQEFNGRDHSTVVYAIKSVKEEMERDSSFRSVVEDIIKNVKTSQ
ncbi:MAG: chromosomal replication initiator protein DnaA [Oscillospiraceae bacterium]|nr:chromosomal replication initiator protein DnaA [Oscillospiraceae bacterium]